MGQLLKWAREELGQMNQKTNKMITMHEMIMTDYVCQEKKEIMFACIEDSVDASIWRLEGDIEKSKERQVTITVLRT